MKNKTSKQKNGNGTGQTSSPVNPKIEAMAKYFGISYESAEINYNRYCSTELYEELEEQLKHEAMEAIDGQTAGEHLESHNDDLVKHENPKIALVVCLASATLAIAAVTVLCVYLSQFFI
jgi:hypothetical protein